MQKIFSIKTLAALAVVGLTLLVANCDEINTTTTTTTASNVDSSKSQVEATSDGSSSTTSSTTVEPKLTDLNPDELETFAKEHPEFGGLVEKVKTGDVQAKDEYERQSLSLRYKQIKENKLASDSDVDVVLNFVDDYVMRLTSAVPSQEPIMKLKDLLSLVDVTEKLKELIRSLGRRFERAECNSECLGHEMGSIMSEAIGGLMMDPMNLAGDNKDSADDSDELDPISQFISETTNNEMNEDNSSNSNATVSGDSFGKFGTLDETASDNDAGDRSEL